MVPAASTENLADCRHVHPDGSGSSHRVSSPGAGATTPVSDGAAGVGGDREDFDEGDGAIYGKSLQGSPLLDDEGPEEEEVEDDGSNVKDSRLQRCELRLATCARARQRNHGAREQADRASVEAETMVQSAHRVLVSLEEQERRCRAEAPCIAGSSSRSLRRNWEAKLRLLESKKEVAAANLFTARERLEAERQAAGAARQRLQSEQQVTLAAVASVSRHRSSASGSGPAAAPSTPAGSPSSCAASRAPTPSQTANSSPTATTRVVPAAADPRDRLRQRGPPGRQASPPRSSSACRQRCGASPQRTATGLGAAAAGSKNAGAPPPSAGTGQQDAGVARSITGRSQSPSIRRGMATSPFQRPNTAGAAGGSASSFSAGRTSTRGSTPGRMRPGEAPRGSTPGRVPTRAGTDSRLRSRPDGHGSTRGDSDLFGHHLKSRSESPPIRVVPPSTSFVPAFAASPPTSVAVRDSSEETAAMFDVLQSAEALQAKLAAMPAHVREELARQHVGLRGLLPPSSRPSPDAWDHPGDEACIVGSS